ncbi:hypothetical protein L6452_03453 [Arctium lappa]|uniref:Uncharacterized protein n=1 Tax=Arctium lappa TaxID=4217 RepID=A0ACB9FNG7_ARCLA|nr:hypothetical protein L6452_03453 [Arctium lappa]
MLLRRSPKKLGMIDIFLLDEIEFAMKKMTENFETLVVLGIDLHRFVVAIGDLLGIYRSLEGISRALENDPLIHLSIFLGLCFWTYLDVS